MVLICSASAQAQVASPKAFAEVVAGAQELPGLFTLYQKDEKVWLAIKPEQLDKPFFFSCNIPQSVGERGLYASQMGTFQLASFHKVGSQMQLVAHNTRFHADRGTPQATFVNESFSDSLLSSAAVVSAPGPDKAILVEANTLLFTDLPMYLTRLDSAYHMAYTLDTRNTSFTKVNNDPNATALRVKAHFSVAKLPAPPTVYTATSPVPPHTPDPRSLFVSFQVNFSKLGEQAMRPRLADERIGHFVTSRTDYTEDLAVNPRVRYVNRWRLEKKDPAAALSEPKEPIVYWLDKNIPAKYRASVEGAILEWNKAFERIGFKNAIVVKQQTDKDTFDTMDSRHASVRWFTGADVGFAIGPSQVDPRTGEILDADIGMSDVFARGARRTVVEDLGHPTAPSSEHSCEYAQGALQEMQFSMDLLEARGLAMDSPEAEALAQSYVFAVIMHEVGHTLGFRHNFLASTAYTLNQVNDPAFTKVNGVAGSVMDYVPFNLALRGERQGEYVASTLGPYDYLAVEYAYKPLDPSSEKEQLAMIAARTTTEPLLAYATDEDAGGNGDPQVNRFDMGADPMAYYMKRIRLTRELWDRMQTLHLNPGESYERLTRSYMSGLGQLYSVAPLVARYVGGVRYRRDRAGTGHPLFEPTSAAKQREALKLVTETLLMADSFRVKPDFLARLASDRWDYRAASAPSQSRTLLGVQRMVLDVLMSESVAQRLLDSQDLVKKPTQLLSLAELYDTLQSAIWSELHKGGDISTWRRNLQREHLRKLTTNLVAASPVIPPDARNLLRENAHRLVKQLKIAAARPANRETRAHLAECQSTLTEALKARMQRNS